MPGRNEEGRKQPTPPTLAPPHTVSCSGDVTDLVREDDVVVMTPPKCGTLWTAELLWTMRNNPDLNNPTASLPAIYRSPFLEYDMLDSLRTTGNESKVSRQESLNDYVMKLGPAGTQPDEDGIFLQLASLTPEPRTIRTHLPFSLLPPHLLNTAKVVFVARNPKDVSVSWYHFCSLSTSSMVYRGSFTSFLHMFIRDQTIFGPFWEHVREGWERRNHPNVHVMFYEDMKADIMKELHKLNTFLGTSLSEEQLKKVAQHNSFHNLKDREEQKITFKDDQNNNQSAQSEGSFFRKGVVGSWKEKLDNCEEAQLDQWARDNSQQLGLHFKYSS